METDSSTLVKQTTNPTLVLLFILFPSHVFSQGIAISNSASNAPAAGSMLHVYGTTRIGSATTADGVLIFNNATNAKTVTISPGPTGISYSLILPPLQAAAANYVLLNDGAGNLSWGPPTTGTEWQLLGNPNTNPAVNFLGTTDAQPLRLATNGTERLRINTSGNIGVGTEDPSSKFDIRNGDITLSNSGTAGAIKLQGSSTGKTSIKAGTQGATDIPWVLPPTQGGASTLLTNDGAGNLSWGNLNSLGAATFQLSQGVNYGTSQTISSTTDVDLDGMVVTVPEGTYMIWFSSDVLNGNNSNTCTVTIYTNGSANAISERNFSGLVKKNMVSAMGVVTVTGTSPLEIRVRVRVDANNATFYKRSLMGLKIG